MNYSCNGNIGLTDPRVGPREGNDTLELKPRSMDTDRDSGRSHLQSIQIKICCKPQIAHETPMVPKTKLQAVTDNPQDEVNCEWHTRSIRLIVIKGVKNYEGLWSLGNVYYKKDDHGRTREK